LAEVAWRWSFAAAAWFLVAIFLIAYAGSLPVSPLDRAMWRSGQPALIGRALRHILSGSGFRFTSTAILLVLVLIVGWIVLASLGRVAIVRVAADELGVAESKGVIRPLLFLNFLRVALALGAVVAIAGSVLLASSVWASTHAGIGAVGRFVGLFCFLIWIGWVFLSWLLSFAGALSPIQGSVTVALGTVVELLIRKTGAVFLIGIVFGICHLTIFIAACGAGLFELGLLGTFGTLSVVFGILTATVYCAVADFLYTGRVAAYLSLLRPEEPQVGAQLSDTPPSAHTSAVDQGELILSDLPAPAM
jgi:hypothetical protein